MARSPWLVVSLALVLAALATLARAGEDGGAPRVRPEAPPTTAGEDAGFPRVRHEVLLTSVDGARDAGFIVPATGVSAADGGGLRLEGLNAELQLLTALWSPAASNPEGWAVEARLRPLPEKGPCGPAPATVLVADGEGLVTATLGPATVGLAEIDQPQATAALPPANAARTYRIELQGRRVSLRVDGREVLSVAVSPEWGRGHGLGGVRFQGPRCASAVSEWEALAWETAPYPVPRGVDPRLMNPRVVPAAALEALASRLSPKNAAAVRALSLSPASMVCVGLTAVDDAVRLGARRGFNALVSARPSCVALEAPVKPPITIRGPSYCGPDQMPEEEVMERARLAARTLGKLPSTLAPGVLERARDALGAPPVHPPPPPDLDPLELLRKSRERQGPISDPVPNQCPPQPPPSFPYPDEVTAAIRAVDLVGSWQAHPQNLYDTLRYASTALCSPADQAQLVAHLRAIAAGKRTCR